MQIGEFLGHCNNLYKRLNAIYKDVPLISVVVGNSQNSFYVAHGKYRTSYKIFGEPKYFDCHKDYGTMNCEDFVIDWESVIREYNI